VRAVELLPYLLGGGAVTAIIAALRWGRQDSRDEVESARSNTEMAMSLRNIVHDENAQLRQEDQRKRLIIAELEHEVTRLKAIVAMLRRKIRDLGGDPSAD
jgi:archaellum component FlaC